MKIILTQDIKGTGKKGQVIDVSDGYARNFVLPRKLGLEATKENLATLEHQKKTEEKRRIEELEKAMALKTKLEEMEIRVEVKVGGTGKLFGSVTSKEIATALELQTGLVIDRKKIQMDEAIKSSGRKTIGLKLHQDVTAKLNVIIAEA